MHRPKVLAFTFGSNGDLVLAAKSILENAGPPNFQVAEAVLPENSPTSCAHACLRVLQESRPDWVLICSGRGQDEHAKAVLGVARDISPDLPVLVLAQDSTLEEICEFLKAGAQDFVLSPLTATELLPRLWRLMAETPEPPERYHDLKERLGLKSFIGQSQALLAACERIPTIAQCSANVLILGETGTGKELCARAIHYLSPRSNKPFVPLNCGAIPVDLVENQLFGHEREAFTGANSATPGLLRAAESGTVFLDEVDNLPLAAQVKLLRFLQEREFQPLGSERTYTADVRVIAASNTNLEEAVQAHRFRRDLYYRLSVVPIQLPPLRKRAEDIPLLAQHFLHKYTDEFGRGPKTLSHGALQKLMSYDWPGNVRELENIVERAVILSEGSLVGSEDIQLPLACVEKADSSFKMLKAKAIGDFERSYIQELLVAHEGNITKAAIAAKKHRRAFWQLMQKHKIKPVRHSSFDEALL